MVVTEVRLPIASSVLKLSLALCVVCAEALAPPTIIIDVDALHADIPQLTQCNRCIPQLQWQAQAASKAKAAPLARGKLASSKGAPKPASKGAKRTTPPKKSPKSKTQASSRAKSSVSRVVYMVNSVVLFVFLVRKLTCMLW